MLSVDFNKKGIWLSKLLLYILLMGSVHCELGMLVWMNWDPGWGALVNQPNFDMCKKRVREQK